jgi:hypothetical protein
MVDGHYDAVYFYTQHLAALKRVFQSVEVIRMDGFYVKISADHRRRFIFMDIRLLKNTDTKLKISDSVIYDPTL